MKTPQLALILSLVFLAAFSPPPTSAQAERSRPLPGDAHLQEISASLSRIAELLETQLESRKLDLVMQRIDIRHRRLAPLEVRLRSARSTRDGFEEQRFRLRSELENMASQLTSGALDTDVDAIGRQTNYVETELTLAESRLRETDSEIAALENEVARYRNEIEDWEAWVDRELSGL